MKLVSDLKDGIAGILTGTDLTTVTSVNVAIERAVRVMSQKIYIPEASARQSYMVYDSVYDYAAPDAIFGGSFMDFRPQGVSRNETEFSYNLPIQTFDRTKVNGTTGAELTFEFDAGTPIMRAKSVRATPTVILDDMTVTTGWTAAGSASGLTTDATVYYDAPASLRFLLTGASTGTLTKTINSINIATYEDVGVAFLAIYCPTPIASLTSIELRLGSSSGAYNNVSSTAGFVGAFKAGKWLLVPFDFSTASQTGTPNWSAITYVQVRITHSAGITNFRVGDLFISLPSPYDLIYKTASVFLNSSSVQGSAITNDNDSIILREDAYNILEHEAAKAVAFNNGATQASAVIQMINTALDGIPAERVLGLYDLYRAAHPSEVVSVIGNWYDE